MSFKFIDKSIHEYENFTSHFSVRTLNCLDAAQIDSMEDLLSKTESDLLRVRNFGHHSLLEIKGRLRECGLKLKKRNRSYSE